MIYIGLAISRAGMSWNVFRYLGDFSHLLSFVFLLHRLWISKTAAGISLKTQELYLLVFITRYLDLFKTFHSLYNTCMKIIYIGLSALLVYALRFKKPWRAAEDDKKTYHTDDTFPHIPYAVLPSLVLAIVWNESPEGFKGLVTNPMGWAFEVAWAFSIFLEAVAIMPQFVLIGAKQQVEGITSHYMASLGLYRALYLANWVWRYFTEPHYWALLPWVAGVVQTIIYSDFLWTYSK